MCSHPSESLAYTEASAKMDVPPKNRRLQMEASPPKTSSSVSILSSVGVASILLTD